MVCQNHVLLIMLRLTIGVAAVYYLAQDSLSRFIAHMLRISEKQTLEKKTVKL